MICASCGLQVNMKVLKAATSDIRSLAASEPNLEGIAREARCAAFACGAGLVVATQEKENIFAILLKDPKSPDPAGKCCDNMCKSVLKVLRRMQRLKVKQDSGLVLSAGKGAVSPVPASSGLPSLKQMLPLQTCTCPSVMRCCTDDDCSIW